jgi:hypothetical protein
MILYSDDVPDAPRPSSRMSTAEVPEASPQPASIDEAATSGPRTTSNGPDYHQRQAAMQWRREASALDDWIAQQQAHARNLVETRGEQSARNALERPKYTGADGREVTGVAAARARSAQLRQEAEGFMDGSRHPLSDLDAAAIDQIVEQLESGGAYRAEMYMRRGLQRVEGRPDVIRRLAQPLLGTGSARWVFRVQAGTGNNRSVDRMAVDSAGNVQIDGDTPLNLNAGNAEVAIDWLIRRGPESQLVAFQVDEAFIRSVRSGAIPEHDTSALNPPARQVDIHHGDDQLQLSAEHIGQLQDNVVPGTGIVISLSDLEQGG